MKTDGIDATTEYGFIENFNLPKKIKWSLNKGDLRVKINVLITYKIIDSIPVPQNFLISTKEEGRTSIHTTEENFGDCDLKLK